jgi:hypothetical protein
MSHIAEWSLLTRLFPVLPLASLDFSVSHVMDQEQ